MLYGIETSLKNTGYEINFTEIDLDYDDSLTNYIRDLEYKTGTEVIIMINKENKKEFYIITDENEIDDDDRKYYNIYRDIVENILYHEVKATYDEQGGWDEIGII